MALEKITEITGSAAYEARYASWAGAKGLGPKVGAFVEGGANFISAVGVPLKMAMGIMAAGIEVLAAEPGVEVMVDGSELEAGTPQILDEDTEIQVGAAATLKALRMSVQKSRLPELPPQNAVHV